MKDVSDLTVYIIQVKTLDYLYHKNTKIIRMALHPMHNLPATSGYHSQKYPFRIVFKTTGRFSSFVGWHYSCLGKNRQGKIGKRIGRGSYIEALQWLIDGEK